MARIALIEDAPPLSEQYHHALTQAGHHVFAYLTLEEAQAGLLVHTVDAWVLDLNLSNDKNAGINLLGWAKKHQCDVPTLVVSGLEATFYSGITRALEVWDFVSKPVDDDSLVHKVELLLAATAITLPTPSLPSIPGLEIDSARPCVIKWREQRISLSVTQWQLLVQLIKTPGQPVTKQALYECVKTGRTDDNIRKHLSDLRWCFKEFDPDFKCIQNVPGKGYRWVS